MMKDVTISIIYEVKRRVLFMSVKQPPSSFLAFYGHMLMFIYDETNKMVFLYPNRYARRCMHGCMHYEYQPNLLLVSYKACTSFQFEGL